MKQIDTELLRQYGCAEMADQIESTQAEIDRFVGLVMLYGEDRAAYVLGTDRFDVLMTNVSIWNIITETMAELLEELRNES